MPNMSYCRFHNTLADLNDCYEHIADNLIDNIDEEIARAKLIRLCKRIAQEEE
jgi:hypothetical protein